MTDNYKSMVALRKKLREKNEPKKEVVAKNATTEKSSEVAKSEEPKASKKAKK